MNAGLNTYIRDLSREKQENIKRDIIHRLKGLGHSAGEIDEMVNHAMSELTLWDVSDDIDIRKYI